ncbi:MAG: TlpA family protein disulfide reductase [Chloroflexota bacterium]|nr:TlpA family protein disulfide reductase [Chloroflexota bacterium]
MPGWQHFFEQQRQHVKFQFVSVAVDMQGAEAARPWVEAAGAAFPTVLDSENHLAQLYGYKLIPNGIFLDEQGVVRYRKFGGFSVENEVDVDAVKRLIHREAEQIEADSRRAPYELSDTERALVDARMRLGAELFRRGARDEALREWRAALGLDPENLTIRKQIWMAESPERFHPTIDFAWQQEQLARERAEEIATGICGPDGCPLPRSPHNP